MLKEVDIEKKLKANKSEVLRNLRSDLTRFRAKTNQLKAKGKSISTYDVLMQSKKADTTFSKIEKKFF